MILSQPPYGENIQLKTNSTCENKKLTLEVCLLSQPHGSLRKWSCVDFSPSSCITYSPHLDLGFFIYISFGSPFLFSSANSAIHYSQRQACAGKEDWQPKEQGFPNTKLGHLMWYHGVSICWVPYYNTHLHKGFLLLYLLVFFYSVIQNF